MVNLFPDMVEIVLSPDPLDISACIRSVMAPGTGGIDVFIGTVRDATGGKKVIRLEFEAYEAMAVKEMEKIAAEARALWPLQKIVVQHTRYWRSTCCDSGCRCPPRCSFRCLPLYY